MSNEKKYLRKQVKERLKRIRQEDIVRASDEIIKKIINLKEWKESQTIGLTISIGKEIDTYALIRKGWEQNKKIVIPKTTPVQQTMDFYRIENFSQIEESYFGLKEPNPSRTQLVNSNEINLIIIPCIAFDHNGFRIGYGGGYYDRYLASFKGMTCGIALDSQRVDHVPTNEYDIPLQLIVTEKNIYNNM